MNKEKFSDNIMGSQPVPMSVPVCLDGYTHQTNITYTTNDGKMHNSKCVADLPINTNFDINDINYFISSYLKYYNANSIKPIFSSVILSNGANFNYDYITSNSSSSIVPVVHNFFCNINNSAHFNLKYYSAYSVIFAYSNDITKYNTYSIQTSNYNDNLITTDMKSTLINFIQNNIPRVMYVTDSVDLTSDNTINIHTLPFIIIDNIKNNHIINIKTFSNMYLPIIIDNSSVTVIITFV